MRTESNEDGIFGRLRMLYHNGYAQDESIGQIVAAARKAKYTKLRGEGPNQVWRDTQGRRLELTSIRTPHDMGCVPSGPVLEIEWTSAPVGS